MELRIYAFENFAEHVNVALLTENPSHPTKLTLKVAKCSGLDCASECLEF